MIFGSADFEGIPMETLIKEYRKNADFSLNDNIQLIKDDFLKYLSENTLETNLSKKIKYSLFVFKEFFNSQISNFDEDSFLDYIDSHITNDLPDFVKNLSEFNNYDVEFEQLIPDYINSNHDEIVNNLKNIFFNSFINGGTGIVIAGFNKNDMFPSYFKFNLCWNENNKIQIFDCKSEINFNGNAIIPFAQNDVINTFLTGIDDYIKLSFYKYLRSFTQGFTDELINYFNESGKIDDKSLNEVKIILSKCETTNDKRVDMFIHNFENLTENFVGEILDSVGSLPKEELANMSESLIHITSLKRKISSDLESVGGDIDVAIISKGDGFIWKKKKHYFDDELNPQFFYKKYSCQKV